MIVHTLLIKQTRNKCNCTYAYLKTCDEYDVSSLNKDIARIIKTANVKRSAKASRRALTINVTDDEEQNDSDNGHDEHQDDDDDNDYDDGEKRGR